jgi:GcrA cell cycle regulator
MWWTDERIAHAKALYADNLTHDQISKAMGCSRNSVIGKMRRLGISGKTGSQPRRIDAEPRHKKDQNLVVMHQPKPVEPDIEPLGQPDEWAPKGTCQFIYGDEAGHDWRMCGRPGYPWCDYHRRKVFQPTPRKDKEMAIEANRVSGSKRIFG